MKAKMSIIIMFLLFVSLISAYASDWTLYSGSPTTEDLKKVRATNYDAVAISDRDSADYYFPKAILYFNATTNHWYEISPPPTRIRHDLRFVDFDLASDNNYYFLLQNTTNTKKGLMVKLNQNGYSAYKNITFSDNATFDYSASSYHQFVCLKKDFKCYTIYKNTTNKYVEYELISENLVIPRKAYDSGGYSLHNYLFGRNNLFWFGSRTTDLEVYEWNNVSWVNRFPDVNNGQYSAHNLYELDNQKRVMFFYKSDSSLNKFAYFNYSSGWFEGFSLNRGILSLSIHPSTYKTYIGYSNETISKADYNSHNFEYDTYTINDIYDIYFSDYGNGWAVGDGGFIYNYTGTGSYTNATSQSSQSEDECLKEEFCLLKDTFPYTDSPTLHGWYGGETADIKTKYLDDFGTRAMLLDNVKDVGNISNLSLTIDIYKNLENDDIYSRDLAETQWYFNYDYHNFMFEDFDWHRIFVEFLDTNDNDIANFILDVHINPSDPQELKMNLSYWNGSNMFSFSDENVTYIDTITLDKYDFKYSPKINVYFNHNQKIYAIIYTKSWDNVENDYNWETYDNVSFTSGSNNTKISKVRIISEINEQECNASLLYIKLYGTDIDTSQTNCDTWEAPYYLKENFYGYLSQCGWTTSEDIYFFGNLSISKENSYFAEKDTDLIKDDYNRYTTFEYSLYLEDYNTDGNVIFRIYDSDYTNFVTLYTFGGDLYYDNDGTGTLIYSGISKNFWHTIKIITDFQEDNFYVYLDDSKLLSDGQFTNSFLNIEDIQTIKIQSYGATYKIGYIYVYSSDNIGNKIIANTPHKQINNETSMCGLFYKETPNCLTDDDCLTGKCTPQHKCSAFNEKWCDENGYTRGNKCMFAGVSQCVLSSTTDLIMDNFLWFLVLIVLLIIFVYFKIAFKD